MKVLADESVDRQIVERLRRDGHEVVYIAEEDPGITDDEVLQRANDLSALLLTVDKDFGELLFQRGSESSVGVVLLRLSGISAEHKAETVAQVFQQHQEQLVQSYIVVTPGRVRIKRKP